ncbi:MAG: 30S ribosomal protein S2 [Candidatus Marinimicrobia bacterium]|jgi:small subunit ribosomal protein S2|nr:30S ribosomal protein S2 [Candidatus Neomarinimicrobiota bacterium]MDP6456911.1 30S ribosomal protein S2 [Candidatus Neomarinimicrobiota bacterium]MDP6592788.1 30S ribosomal protein S2 [Candidatus Neomarinimicrobiota bacterium]MDP6836309.1 30S ribosomal protein S2 [Candidatus Neomarinimicrobiota bacterium]|tara:strand:- start:4692 stop:5582 length:891 start_codon:yes stop_codon:yes gene_type:complete
MNITFDDLLSTGAHFGHLTRKWHPNYRPYILMVRNSIHIINLEETLKGLEQATVFLSDVADNGGEILFVGTKKNAKDIVQQEADKCGMFYVVERWLGGTLTNFSTIRKSIKRLQLLEKESSPLYENATKKEILSLEREMIRLQDLHRGIKDMKRLPNAIFVVDANLETIALQEARHLDIPVVAIVDSNTDPTGIDYAIPANDDSIRAVKLIVGEVSRTICEAKNMAYLKDGESAAAATDEEPAEEESVEISTNGDGAESEIDEEPAAEEAGAEEKSEPEEEEMETSVEPEETKEEK